MSDIKRIALIGGDNRMHHCALALADEGFDVIAAGMRQDEKIPPAKALEDADAVILPVPVSRDGVSIFAPGYPEKISAAKLLSGFERPVFCGMPAKLKTNVQSEKNIYSYSEREDFKAANAIPTAEGAVCVAIKEYEGCLNGAAVLVTGFGKTGKALSLLLRNMGAAVSVSARKESDLAAIQSLGMAAVNTAEISGRYDIIFNTVPAVVLGEAALCHSPGCLVIDIASMPGGVDEAAAARLGVRVRHELSLPGRFSPMEAGRIIKNTVLNIIEEEGL